MRVTRWRPVLAVLAAGLAACGGGGPAGPEIPTAVPTTTAGGDSVREFEGEGTPMEPGRYSYSAFDPAFTFEVGEGWLGGHVLPEFFDVQRDEVITGWARPDRVIGADAEPVDTEGLSPEDAIETIVGNPANNAGEVTTSTIGTRPSVQVVLQPRTFEPIFGGPEGEFNAAADRVVRVDAFEVNGVLLLAVAQVPPERTEQGFALADEVNATVEFE